MRPTAPRKAKLRRTRSVKDVVSQVSRFLTARGAGSASRRKQTPAERLWGVVRAVVLVDFEHPDMQLAFREHYEASGQPDVEDEAQYLQMWREARLHYIRRRLRGEWFPEQLQESAGRWYLRPDGAARRAWDAALLFVVAFNAVEVPFVVGLSPRQRGAVEGIELAITAVFAADVVVNFLTALDRAGRSGQARLATPRSFPPASSPPPRPRPRAHTSLTPRATRPAPPPPSAPASARHRPPRHRAPVPPLLAPPRRRLVHPLRPHRPPLPPGHPGGGEAPAPRVPQDATAAAAVPPAAVPGQAQGEPILQAFEGALMSSLSHMSARTFPRHSGPSRRRLPGEQGGSNLMR